MKRDVPGYVEKAVFSLRNKPEYVQRLCRLFPDTMRWISYQIDEYLYTMHAEEIKRFETLDKEKRAEGKAGG